MGWIRKGGKSGWAFQYRQQQRWRYVLLTWPIGERRIVRGCNASFGRTLRCRSRGTRFIPAVSGRRLILVALFFHHVTARHPVRQAHHRFWRWRKRRETLRRFLMNIRWKWNAVAGGCRAGGTSGDVETEWCRGVVEYIYRWVRATSSSDTRQVIQQVTSLDRSRWYSSSFASENYEFPYVIRLRRNLNVVVAHLARPNRDEIKHTEIFLDGFLWFLNVYY